MKVTYYIELDVHKDFIALAYISSASQREAIHHGTCGGSNTAVERALRQLAKTLGRKLQELEVCYAAGLPNLGECASHVGKDVDEP